MEAYPNYSSAKPGPSTLPSRKLVEQREMGEFLPLLQLKESKETPLGKEQMPQAEKFHHKGGEHPDGLLWHTVRRRCSRWGTED